MAGSGNVRFAQLSQGSFRVGLPPLVVGPLIQDFQRPVRLEGSLPLHTSCCKRSAAASPSTCAIQFSL